MQMLEASADSLAASMQQAALASQGVNPRGYAAASRAMKLNSQVARDAAQSTGLWAAEQVKLNTAADDYNKKLAARKLSLGDIRREAGVAKAAYREQLALQQMVARSAGKIGGKELFDIYTPTQLNAQLDTAANRFGFLREQIRSASHQMVNWGKNTQWAGRQLMVGLTMPVAAFGAAAGVMAYQIEDELTRIQKVYDTTAQAVAGDAQSMAAVEKELAQVRIDSLDTARKAARDYASSGQETLQVQADLAAIGLKGVELQKQTNEVMRIATLGELDRQTATEMTISLQSVFRMSNQELAESFNYLNAIENATSLSTQDFAAAIPIAAAPIKAFGGDVQELGVLLTAMRERGIAATQGANAIKAAMQRLGRPSKQVRQEFEELTGGNIVKLVDESNSLSEIFTKLYHITQDLSAADQRKVFAGLFGSYQVTRMMALTEGMGELERGVGQVSTAYEVAGKSSSEWAATAQMEIDRMMQSSAKQFKAQLEALKLNMAEMGEPFLDVATVVMKAINAILSAFNDLPKGVKIVAGLTVGLLALAGPVIMLAGLFANLAGNLGNFFVMITRGAVQFELLNKESAAAQIANKLASSGFVTAGSAAQTLTTQLERLTLAYQSANAASARSLGQIPAPVNVGMHGPVATGRTPVVPGGIVSNATGSQLLDRQGNPITSQMVDDTAKINQNSKGIRSSWRDTSKLMGGATVAMIAGQASSSEMGSNIANMAMAAMGVSSVFTMFGGRLPKMKRDSGGLKTAWAGIGGVVKNIGSWVMRIIKFLPNLVRGIHPIGWALAAVVGAWKLVSHSQGAAAEDQKKLNKNADSWSKHLGYQKEEWGKIGRITRDVAADTTTMVENAARLRASNPEIIEGYMEQATPGGRMKFAEQQYLTMRMTGATHEQALQNINQLFLAAGDSIEEANKRMSTFRDRIKGLDTLDDRAQVLKTVRNEMELLGKQKWLEEDASDMGPERFQYKRLWKDPKRFFESIFGDEQKEAYEIGAGMADEIEHGLSTFKNPFRRANFMRDVQNQLNSQWRGILNGIHEETVKSLSRSGIDVNNIEQMKKVIRDAGDMGYAEFMEKYNATYNDWMRLSSMADGRAGQLLQTEKGLTETLRNRVNAQGKANTLVGLQMDNQGKILGITKQQAQAEYQNQLARRKQYEIARGVMTWSQELTDEQKLQVLNQQRVAYGLEKTGNLLDGFGPVTRKWKNEQKGVNDEISEAERRAKRAKTQLQKMMDAISNEKITGAVKDAYTSWQQGVADATLETFDNQQTRAMEGLEATQEAAMDRFEQQAEGATERMERRHDRAMQAMERRAERATERLERDQERRRNRIENGFDRRIERIQNVMEQEQKAEDLRQRIFDAEMQRLDRLNERANRNIDFNVAINTGNLDEAAKIRNDMESQAAAWALGDASTAQERRFQARQGRLEGRIEHVEEARDKRLEALDRVEDAERKSLDRRLKRERRHLERRQEAERKFREEQQERDRKALQKAQERTRRAEEKKWNTRRRYLERSLDDFTGYIATSDKDLRRHIKIWEKEHKGLSLTTRGQFNRTSDAINKYIKKSVTKAGKQIVNEANWEMNGWRIAKKMIKGAFGMSPKEFRKFIATGKPPKGYGKRPVERPGAPNRPGSNRGPVRASRNERWAREKFRHTGGPIGGDGGSRKGYARTMGMHRNEVPIIGEKGEFVVNKRAAKKHAGLLNSINKDGIKRNEPLPIGGSGMDAGTNLGMASVFGMMMAGALRTVVENGIVRSGRRAENQMMGVFGAAKAGKYGDVVWSREQLKNAALIASVGKRMKMSRRDIVIGLMTAMQESGLRNLNWGDRDSVGLFQQRTSQGWGTVSQIMDPEYSSRKFFAALRGIKDRDRMSKTQAAQAVQRSGFPHAYAKWENEAKAIMAAMTLKPGGGFLPGTGKRTHPTRGAGHVTNGIHGSPPAIDIGLPVGKGIYAVRGGVVSTSRDLRGYEPRAPHGGGGYRSYGRYIVINHDGGGSSLYAHLSQRYARKGQRVQAGARIGRSGNTGYSFGPHLHFGATGASPYSFLSLQKGAANVKWDNTIANLHKGEAVLTKDLNEKFHQGVERFANGGETIYNLNMNFGSVSDRDEIARHVVRTIKRAEARKPRSRR